MFTTTGVMLSCSFLFFQITQIWAQVKWAVNLITVADHATLPAWVYVEIYG